MLRGEEKRVPPDSGVQGLRHFQVQIQSVIWAHGSVFDTEVPMQSEVAFGRGGDQMSLGVLTFCTHTYLKQSTGVL